MNLLQNKRYQTSSRKVHIRYLFFFLDLKFLTIEHSCSGHCVGSTSDKFFLFFYIRIYIKKKNIVFYHRNE